MASMNTNGTILARCTFCGANSVFEWTRNGQPIGATNALFQSPGQSENVLYRLFACTGCGQGALGEFTLFGSGSYPTEASLKRFSPEAKQRLNLPKSVPNGIKAEFREAESCLDHDCYRAAAGLFRSVLDKTFLANGYKAGRTNLSQAIDEAAKDGIITAAHQRRAHEEIRVLGNDILHDEWRPITAPDVELAHQYSQRILEDFYDYREEVIKQLINANRPFDKEESR